MRRRSGERAVLHERYSRRSLVCQFFFSHRPGADLSPRALTSTLRSLRDTSSERNRAVSCQKNSKRAGGFIVRLVRAAAPGPGIEP